MEYYGMFGMGENVWERFEYDHDFIDMRTAAKQHQLWFHLIF